jgi:hypothetical protein
MSKGRLYGHHALSRRTLLRGLLGGAIVSIGLPPLERFLNVNGTAYAAGGDDGFPRRFGLFFWGNGILPARWTPASTAADWQLSDQLAPLQAMKSKITVVTGTKLGVPNSQPHGAGAAGLLSGMPLLLQGNNQTFAGPSIDQIIANVIGNETRFRSLEFGAAPSDGYSFNGPNSLNPPEKSANALFQRIFGQGFTMPGDTPKIDPTLALRQSVLDAIGDDIKRLEIDVGAADKQRLEQHFEGIRLLEKRLAKLQEAPPKLDACKVPKEPELEYPDIEGRPQMQLKNQVFSEMMAYTLACDQSRVFSNWFTHPVNNILFKNASTGHHELTHNEADPQPEVHKITVQIVEALAAQIAALDAVQEGAGTLLDHMVVLGCSETGLAKTHSMEEMPIVLAGSAGGKLKTGMHYRSQGGENSSKVMLSLCRAVGADLPSYGSEGGEAKSGLSAIEL